MDVFARAGSDLRLEWGAEGVAGLGRECALLIVVDVLSFSTTVDLGTSRSGRVRAGAATDRRDPGWGTLGVNITTTAAGGLRGCSPGREPTRNGHERDVELAAQADVSATAPILVDDLLEAA